MSGRTTKQTAKTERRANELLISFVSFSLLIVMSIMVDSPNIPDWEITSFELINNLPDFLFPILWPFMQYGVFVTIPVVSAVAVYFKRYKLAVLLLLGGIGIYFAARYLKEYVPRGRPGDLLDGVRTREYFAPWSKGFTSGHTAVASTIATFSHYYLSKKWRIISLFTLAVVLIGRVYVGAHLPLDVLGGVALGTGVASLINFIVGVPVPEHRIVENTKEWIRVHRPRHPGDIVRIGVASLVFLLTTLLAMSGSVSQMEEAVFRVVNYLPSFLSPAIETIMQFGALYFVFIAALTAAAFRHNRLFLKILSGGVSVWILARIAKAMIDRERPFYLLQEIVERSTNSGILGFPSGHASVAALIATVSAPYVKKTWSRVFWSAAWITALGRIFVGAHLPLDVIAGLSLGWFVGSIMNVAFGTPAKPWPKKAVMSRLKDAGLQLRTISDAAVDARGSVPLFGRTRDGQDVFIKLIDSEHRNADILYRLWRYITLREVQDEAPFASPKQQSEHEAYLSIQAAQAGVRVPEVLMASPVDRSASIIVSEKIDAEVLTKYDGVIDVRLMKKIWQQVKLLHANRIAHRDLRATNIMIDTKRQPWLIDFSFSQTAASDVLLFKDVVELIASLSLVAEPELVIRSARSVLGDDMLKKAAPYVQPLALTSYTRKRVAKRPELLDTITHEIADQTQSRRVAPIRLSRVSMRWLGFLIALGLTVYYFVPRISELNESVDALQSADLLLVGGVVAGSVLTYMMSAVVVQGATMHTFRYWHLLILQFAGTAVNRITPKGVGGALLLEQFLEKKGLKRVEATAAVSLVYTAGLLMHLVLTILVVALDDPDLLHEFTLSQEQWMLLGFGLAIVFAGVFFIPKAKRFLLRWGAEVVDDLRVILRKPKKALKLFGGSAGVTLAYALAFGLSVNAFGPNISFDDALFVYLASGILASSAPTPGGLGATEALLSIGLSLNGVATGQAVTSVLVFRLITFWLPILPGVIALRYMRKKKLI